MKKSQSFDKIDEFSHYSMNELLNQKKPVNMQKQSATTLPIIKKSSVKRCEIASNLFDTLLSH